jgi:hypothetical protein
MARTFPPNPPVRNHSDATQGRVSTVRRRQASWPPTFFAGLPIVSRRVSCEAGNSRACLHCLPAELVVGPPYGMIVLTDSSAAQRFALILLSEQDQAILLRHGFDPIGLQGR